MRLWLNFVLIYYQLTAVAANVTSLIASDVVLFMSMVFVLFPIVQPIFVYFNLVPGIELQDSNSSNYNLKRLRSKTLVSNRTWACFKYANYPAITVCFVCISSIVMFYMCNGCLVIQNYCWNLKIPFLYTNIEITILQRELRSLKSIRITNELDLI